MKRFFVLFVVLLATSVVFAQEKPSARIDALTIDQIMRGPQFAGYEPRDVRWSPDGQRAYFRWKEHGEPIEKDFATWVVSRDGKGLRRLSDDEEKDAPPVRAAWTRDHRRAVFIDSGDVVLWDGRHRNLTDTIEPESNPRFTRDEHHVAFVRANNLFVLSLDDGGVEQVTNIAAADDKQPLWDDKKGTPSQEFVKAEERKLLDVVARRAAKREEDEAKRKREHPLEPLKLEKKQSVVDLQLTPDGKYVIASLTAEAEKGKRTIVPNYVTESGYTEDINSREKVGDVLAVTKLASISTADGKVKWFSSGLQPAEPVKSATRAEEKQVEKEAERTEKSERGSSAETAKERDVTFGAVLFSDDGTKAVLSLRARDNKDWWIMAFDPAAAKGRVIVTVHDDAWVRRMQRNVGWLPDNATIWFISEASGWAHLWTAPYTGGGANQITSGEWEVDDVTLSDDKKSLYLLTSEESLYERHLYRMPAGGGARTKVTSAPGRHDAVVSPDGKAIADLYSYTNVPTELYIGTLSTARPANASQKQVDGNAVRITTSPAPEFFTYPWLDVPIVTFRATDGVEVPGRIYKPAAWKPGGPAVLFVHGAGYLQNVHRWWSDYFREFMFNHFLMEHGYLVFDIDYRGSAGHGRDWRTAIYRHMGGRDLADEVDAARWLEKEYGVDSTHIGMYGGSYGGFMTLMGLFTAPSAFRSGAALRPVTDWSHYNHGYTSDILNTPQSDPEAYRKSSPIYFAEGLRGSLLICHGVADTNVHFQDTVRLVEKLIELHAQDWDLAIYPVEDHGFVEPSSWSDEYKRIFRLFERTLK